MSLLEKCLRQYPDYFIKLCRIGIEYPHLAPKVLILLEKMAQMSEDAADLDTFMVKLQQRGERRDVSAR